MLKSTLLDPYGGKGDLYYTEPAGWEERFKVDPDTLLEEFDAPRGEAGKQGQVERSVRRMRYWSSSGSSGSEERNVPSSQRAQAGAAVYLFLLGQTPGSRINERMKMAVYFIVLGLSADHPGKFERVGCATGGVDEDRLEEVIRLHSQECVITIV